MDIWWRHSQRSIIVKVPYAADGYRRLQAARTEFYDGTLYLQIKAEQQLHFLDLPGAYCSFNSG